jgi:hypothetical protein
MRRRSGLSDTTPAAERVWIEVHRSMPPGRKLRLQLSGFRTEKALHESGYRSRHPGATPGDIHRSWVRQRLGDGPWATEEPHDMGTSEENIEVVRRVMSVFDHLGIPCALGGSWASSYYGIARSTFDADLNVEPFPGQEAAFVASFGSDYYVSLDAVRQAVRSRSTFNVIGIAAGFKVDVFVSKGSDFDRSVIERRRPVVPPDDPLHSLTLVAPEDIVLHKLEWYRIGGEQSERQWLDVQGVLKVQANSLDREYLRRWATRLGVDDLLAEALDEATGAS